MPRGQVARGYLWRALGDRLKEARERAGLTQPAVARLLGVSSRTVWYWEVGRSRPRYERLVRLADLYGVSTEWLLGREGRPPERTLLEEAELALRTVGRELPPEALQSIQDFILFLRQRYVRERRGLPEVEL